MIDPVEKQFTQIRNGNGKVIFVTDILCRLGLGGGSRIQVSCQIRVRIIHSSLEFAGDDPGRCLFFNKLKRGNTDLMAYCGLDMHRPDNFFFVSTTVSALNNKRKEILDAMKAGNFASHSRYFNIEADGVINRFYYLYVWNFNCAIKFARWLRDIFSRG